MILKILLNSFLSIFIILLIKIKNFPFTKFNKSWNCFFQSSILNEKVSILLIFEIVFIDILYEESFVDLYKMKISLSLNNLFDKSLIKFKKVSLSRIKSKLEKSKINVRKGYSLELYNL